MTTVVKTDQCTLCDKPAYVRLKTRNFQGDITRELICAADLGAHVAYLFSPDRVGWSVTSVSVVRIKAGA